jgi:hypothetical protein
MNTTHFEQLVGVGIRSYGVVSAIGQAIRDYANECDIAMTETEFCEILCEVHKRVR